MKTKRFYRIAGSCIVLLALIILATPAIRAEEGTIPATITIAEGLTIDAVNPLEFGMITAPLNGYAQWIVNPLTGNLVLTTGDPTSADLIANDHIRGTFRIYGTSGLSVNFTVTVTTDFADPQLSLLSVQAEPPSPQILDINGQLEVLVGGTLGIDPGVASGEHNDAVITMVANY